MRPFSRLPLRSSLHKLLAAGISGLCLASCGGATGPGAGSQGGATGGGSTITLPVVEVGTVAAADPGSALAAGWQHGAFMEIYVRGYQDSDGDGVGDLRGLTQRLDYLRELGIKGIWLMPVTRSQDGDHGYAVSDYRNIESAYGSLADFDEFVKQAHARGIGVIIDYVMNHSGAKHPLFVNASAAAGNPYRSWYVWQNPAPAGWNIYGSYPWYSGSDGAYFAAFGSSMPDFNLKNPAVLAYHQDNLRFWLNRGVDGMRFDAVGHLVENGPAAWNNQPENYGIMGQINSVITGYRQRYLVCEAPDDPRGFAAPAACGSAFAFDHSADIVKAAKGDAGAIQAMADYFKSAPAGMATMVSNHDAFAGQRLWDQLGGNQAQYRLAAASYLLQPGTPFIYYGEEIGMSGGAGLAGDWKLRTPMSWNGNSSNAGFTSGQAFRALSANVSSQNVAAQLADPDSLLAFYQAMLALRNSRPSIARGSYEAAFVNGKVLGFQRKLGSERTLVLINYGSAAGSLVLNGLAGASSLAPAYPANGATYAVDAGGNATLSINAQSVAVFAIQP